MHAACAREHQEHLAVDNALVPSRCPDLVDAFISPVMHACLHYIACMASFKNHAVTMCIARMSAPLETSAGQNGATSGY